MPDPAPNEPTPEKAIVPEVISPKSEMKAPEFDPLAFWIQYRGLITKLFAVILIGVTAWGVYEIYQMRRRDGSVEALVHAKSDPEALRKVIADWDGTPAAGSAYLLLAKDLRTKGKADEAIKTLKEFAAKFPNHSLLPDSIVTLATIEETSGKNDEAMEAYKRVATTYPASPAAPLALIGQARLLIAQDKKDEAKKILTTLQQNYPASRFTDFFGSKMLDALNNPNAQATGGSGRPTPPTPPPSAPKLPPGFPSINQGGAISPGPRIELATPPPAPAPAPGTPAPAPVTPAPASPAPAPAPSDAPVPKPEPAPAPTTPTTPAPAPASPAPSPTPEAPKPEAPKPN